MTLKSFFFIHVESFTLWSAFSRLEAADWFRAAAGRHPDVETVLGKHLLPD